MAFDPRTGITTYGAADPAAGVNAAIGVPEAVAPSTATSLPPAFSPELYGKYFPGVDPRGTYDSYNDTWLAGLRPLGVANAAAQAGNLDDWLAAVNAAMQGTEYEDSYNMTGARTTGGYQPYGFYGRGDLLAKPLDQIAAAAGQEGLDWRPFLDQYWFSEWQDQMAHGRTPMTIFGHGQGYGDTLLGVSDFASRGLNAPQIGEIAMETLGPGTDFYRDYNELGNWMDSRKKEASFNKGLSVMLPVLTGLFAPYIAPTVSSAAGGGFWGNVAAGAAMGGLQGLATGDPVGGVVRGGLTAGAGDFLGGGTDAAVAADTGGGAEGMLSRMGFSGDAQFADALDATKRAGALSTGFSTPAQTVEPLFGGGGYSQPAMTTIREPGALVPFTMPTASVTPGMLTPTVPTPKEEPSLLDKASRYVKLGQALSQLGGGGGDEGAPQRAEGQSDADYAQALATYVNVDAQALADMGLTPGTPEYLTYLLSQVDSVLADYEDASDLMGQLRGKTQDELTALRRALFVRGALDQMMGSGTYVDPFGGEAEEVITNGRMVNPNVAAYQRGLGRTFGGFAELEPSMRREAIGGFLDRDVDLYGAQARADDRAEQEALIQQYLADLKRRQQGMFGGAWW